MAAPIPMSRPVEEDSPPLGLVARRGGRGASGRIGRGRRGDSEGVDGRVQLGERPDRAIKVPGEVVFDVTLHERLIGRGNRGPVVDIPHAGGHVGDVQ